MARFEMMTAGPLCIAAGDSIAAALRRHFGATQTHRAYPVTRDGMLVGLVDRRALESAASGEASVGSLYGVNQAIVALAGETCRSVAARLAVHGLERLPVVAHAGSLRVIGLVSRSDLIKATLTVNADESQRQTIRRLYRRGGRDE